MIFHDKKIIWTLGIILSFCLISVTAYIIKNKSSADKLDDIKIIRPEETELNLELNMKFITEEDLNGQTVPEENITLEEEEEVSIEEADENVAEFQDDSTNFETEMIINP